jgi:chaperonin GroES
MSKSNAKRVKEVAAVNFEPLSDRLLVRRLDEEETMRGGIYIPDTAKEKPQEGIVLAVGNGRILDSGHVIPVAVEPGRKVLFGKYAGIEIKIDGEDFLILREEEILGKRK